MPASFLFEQTGRLSGQRLGCLLTSVSCILYAEFHHSGIAELLHARFCHWQVFMIEYNIYWKSLKWRIGML
jgi:hypothetical protein